MYLLITIVVDKVALTVGDGVVEDRPELAGIRVDVLQSLDLLCKETSLLGVVVLGDVSFLYFP